MQNIDFEHEISERGFAGRLILRKATQLANYPGFSQSDIDDIQQELRMQLFSSMSKFDAEKGNWRAFVKATVERNVATIIERQAAAKRGNGDTPVSLSTKVEGEDGLVALENLVGRWNLEARTGGYSESHTDVIDTALDTRRSSPRPSASTSRSTLWPSRRRSRSAAASGGSRMTRWRSPGRRMRRPLSG